MSYDPYNPWESWEFATTFSRTRRAAVRLLKSTVFNLNKVAVALYRTRRVAIPIFKSIGYKLSEVTVTLSRKRRNVLAERDRKAMLARGRQENLERHKTELEEKQQRIDRLEARLSAMEQRQTEEWIGLWKTLKLTTGDTMPPSVRFPPKSAEPTPSIGRKGLYKGLNEAFREPKATAPQPRDPAPQPSVPPVPPAELLSFLQLAIPARTDDYLRQLALVAAHANRIATTSRLLGMELGKILDDRCRSPDPERNPWLG